MITAIANWLTGIDNIWLKLYLFMAVAFAFYFFVRLIIYAFTELGMMFWRIVWGAFVLPILLGLFWPISILNRLIMKRWVAAWMNNIHWWE